MVSPPPKIYLERFCIKYSSFQAYYILIWKCKNTVNYSASVYITYRIHLLWLQTSRSEDPFNLAATGIR